MLANECIIISTFFHPSPQRSTSKEVSGAAAKKDDRAGTRKVVIQGENEDVCTGIGRE
jgi:hypothetical protein